MSSASNAILACRPVAWPVEPCGVESCDCEQCKEGERSGVTVACFIRDTSEEEVRGMMKTIEQNHIKRTNRDAANKQKKAKTSAQ